MDPMPVAATSGVQFIWKGSSTYEDSELDKRYSAGTWSRTGVCTTLLTRSMAVARQLDWSPSVWSVHFGGGPA